MNTPRNLITGCLVLLLTLASVPMAVQAAPEEVASSSAEITATVAAIDQQTRAITLRLDDGKEYSFIASDEVRNFAQISSGDVVTVTYNEALAYEVTKGGTLGVTEGLVAGRAEPGQRPAAGVAHEVVVTVEVIGIDPAAPTITFRGPGGNTRTIPVQHPERLNGVGIGDTVDIIYTEALAVRVEPVE